MHNIDIGYASYIAYHERNGGIILGYNDRKSQFDCDCEKQKHVHELQGSVRIAEPKEDPHNHRFCTVTGEAIYCGDSHIHEVCFRTDNFNDHFHEFKGKTGPAIRVGDRHVHFIEDVTTENDGHRHRFEAATLIENPIGKDYKDKDKDDEYHKKNEYDDYFNRESGYNNRYNKK